MDLLENVAALVLVLACVIVIALVLGVVIIVTVTFGWLFRTWTTMTFHPADDGKNPNYKIVEI